MKTIITTKNKEIYKKFNSLHFNDEIFIKDFEKNKVRQIVNTINKNSYFLEITKIGDYLKIKKINPLDFDIYLKS